MALQKQKISLSLIKGTDTKTNDQISKNYKDMVNIVFSGDMTAKKMNGFDLLGTFSADTPIAMKTKGTDLLLQGQNSFYKHIDSIGFKKLKEIGSSSVEKLPALGTYMACGANYDFHASVVNAIGVDVNGTETAKYSARFTFTDKKGNVLNVAETLIGAPVNTHTDGWTPNYFFRWFKCFAYGDLFYVSYVLNGKLYLQRYSFSVDGFYSDGIGLFNGSAGFPDVVYENIRAMDFVADASNIYIAYALAAGTVSLYKLTNIGAISVVSNVILSGTNSGNIQIHEKDATHFYVSFPQINSVPTPDQSELHQKKILKSDLSTVTDSIVGIMQDYFGTYTGRTHWISYPTSDTTAVRTPVAIQQTHYGFVPTSNFEYGEHRRSQMVNSMGLMPVSKIFKIGTKFYFVGVCISDEQWTYALYRFYQQPDTQGLNYDVIAPQAFFGQTTSGYEEIPQFGLRIYNLSDDNAASADSEKFLYALQEINVQNGEINFGNRGIQPDNSPLRYKITLGDPEYSFLEANQNAVMGDGIVSLYDGQDISEIGFVGKPHIHLFGTVSSGGGLPAGNYRVYAIYRWTDANGIEYHSEPSNLIGAPSLLPVSANQKIVLTIHHAIMTFKQNVYCDVFVSKDTDSFTRQATFQIDNYFDVETENSTNVTISTYGQTTKNIPFYANEGTEIKNTSILGVKHLGLYADSVFAVSSENKKSVFYSKPLEQGSELAFNMPSFFKNVFDKRGVNEDEIVGVCAMDGRLFVFKQRSIVYIVGDVGDVNSGNASLSTPQLVTTDVGCINAKSIILAPDGIMFMSDKGIYLLNRTLIVEYIGAQVERFNQRSITSANLLENVNEIRFTTLEGECLVYNYYQKEWSWFENMPAIDACVWRGKFTWLKTDGKVLVETTSHKKMIDQAIVQKISSPWIVMDNSQGWQKVYDVLILGKYKSEHQIKINVFYDYEKYSSEEYILDPLDESKYNIAVRPTNADLQSHVEADGVYQMTIDMVRKSCQAFRIEITDEPLNIDQNTGESFSLSNIEVTVGVKKGPAKLPAYKSY